MLQQIPASAAPIDFDVVLTSALDSQTTKVGQPVSARLAEPLRVGSRILAPAGSKVEGVVTEVVGARRLLHAELSLKHWMNADASIGIRFNHIVLSHGKAVEINALPLSIETKPTKAGDPILHVSKKGTIEASRKADLKPTVGRTALSIGSIVAAPVTMIAGAGIGAAKPSSVLPTDTNGHQAKPSRLKGMAAGFLAGAPGGSIVDDAALKGRQAMLKSGTRIKLQWKR